MKKLKFEDMQHEATGNGIESVSDLFGGLLFTPSDENNGLCNGLCVGLMHTGRKPLTFHFAIFKPDFSLNKFIQFDIRELTKNVSLHLPLKGKDKLAYIIDMLDSSFSSEHELLSAIISRESESIHVSKFN
ncbi:hypothetical protein G3479_20965 [Shewanella baltica]|uniref:hypothetical protein n=1 Tax=Shewanella baltica TaxID=62322 RepID=UPI00217CF30C|nr:hypothetical protein [Shewanella baltica]MCS6261675.1 hypothetical protein [Shewanella baltica]